MKKSHLRITVTGVAFFLITGIAGAQQNEVVNSAGDQSSVKEQTMSQTRVRVKRMTKEQSVMKEQTRERFRNSLSEEQIALLENREMTRSQKRKAFMASLSAEQRNMLRDNQSVRQQTRNEMCVGQGSGEQEAKVFRYRGRDGGAEGDGAQHRKGNR